MIVELRFENETASGIFGSGKANRHVQEKALIIHNYAVFKIK
jgi:hypothetical protein